MWNAQSFRSEDKGQHIADPTAFVQAPAVVQLDQVCHQQFAVDAAVPVAAAHCVMSSVAACIWCSVAYCLPVNSCAQSPCN